MATRLTRPSTIATPNRRDRRADDDRELEFERTDRRRRALARLPPPRSPSSTTTLRALRARAILRRVYTSGEPRAGTITVTRAGAGWCVSACNTRAPMEPPSGGRLHGGQRAARLGDGDTPTRTSTSSSANAPVDDSTRPSTHAQCADRGRRTRWSAAATLTIVDDDVAVVAGTLQFSAATSRRRSRCAGDDHGKPRRRK